MDNHPIPSLLKSIVTITFFFFFSIALPQSYAQENDTYSVCSQPYSCGSLTNISYPFWGQNRQRSCGKSGFHLMCQNNLNTTIQVGSQTFNVLQINQTGFTQRLALPESSYNLCSPNISNTSLIGSPFSFLPNTVQNITVFYDCPLQISGINSFKCQNNSSKQAFYVNGTQLQQASGLDRCGYRVQVPVSVDIPLDSLKIALDEGFDVKYDDPECETCKASGGICGTTNNSACSASSTAVV